MILNKQDVFLLFVSTILFLLLFNGVAQIVWIALVPFFLSLIIYTNKSQKRKIFLIGFLTPSLNLVCGFWWTFEYSWVIFLLTAALFYLNFTIIVSSFYKLSVPLKKWFNQTNSLFKRIIFFGSYLVLIPFIWCLFSLLLSLIKFGSFFFEWGFFLSRTGIVSQMLNLMGLTFLLLLFNFVLAYLIYIYTHKQKEISYNKERNILLEVLLFIFLIIVVLPTFFSNEESTDTILVAAIQPNFYESWVWRTNQVDTTIIDRNLNLSEQAARQGAKIIVWPEYSLVADIVKDKPQLLEKIKKFTREHQVNLIVGSYSRLPAEGEHQNVALFINSDGDYQGASASTFPGFFNTGAMPANEK